MKNKYGDGCLVGLVTRVRAKPTGLDTAVVVEDLLILHGDPLEELMSLLKEPVQPGEVLKELYLDPLDLGAIALAWHLGVPRTRIERLIKGAAGTTPDTALRLARVFNTTPVYWVNLQTNYDMALAVQKIDVSNIEPLQLIVA